MGHSFTVFRRSRPIGKFVPLNNSKLHEGSIDACMDEDRWVDFIDFTAGEIKDGMPVDEAIELLEKINGEA